MSTKKQWHLRHEYRTSHPTSSAELRDSKYLYSNPTHLGSPSLIIYITPHPSLFISIFSRNPRERRAKALILALDKTRALDIIQTSRGARLPRAPRSAILIARISQRGRGLIAARAAYALMPQCECARAHSRGLDLSGPRGDARGRRRELMGCRAFVALSFFFLHGCAVLVFI